MFLLVTVAVTVFSGVDASPVHRPQSLNSGLSSSNARTTGLQVPHPLQTAKNSNELEQKSVNGRFRSVPENFRLNEMVAREFASSLPNHASRQNVPDLMIYTPLSSRLNLSFIVGLMCLVVTLMVVVEQTDTEDERVTGKTCQFLYLPSKCKRWHGKVEEPELIAPMMQWLNWKFSLLKLCHAGDVIIIFMPVFRHKLRCNIDAWIFPLNHVVLVFWYVIGVILLRRHQKELTVLTRKNAKYGLVCSLFAESLMLLYLFYYGRDFPWGR